MKTILVVGDSLSAGYTEHGYVKPYSAYLAEQHCFDLVNLSRPAVDNRYIKNTMMHYLSTNTVDMVLFHMAPYTRKCFYFDATTKIDSAQFHTYPSFSDTASMQQGWYRSKGRADLPKGHCPGNGNYQQTFNTHFDYYFHNYFHPIDSYLETMEILHSVQTYCKCQNIQYFIIVNNKYFLKDQCKEAQMYTNDLDFSKFIFYNDQDGFDEFIIQNGYQASDYDYHANQQGHEHFSALIDPVIFPVNK